MKTWIAVLSFFVAVPIASAQTDAKPSTIDAKEPGGLNLVAGGKSIRATWGESKQKLSQEIGELVCSPDKGIDTCYAKYGNTSSLWQADFGRSLMERPVMRMSEKSITILGFSPDGEFFRYMAMFPEPVFGEIRDAFIAQLGQPNSRDAAPVQNRLGAQFDQEDLVWTTTNTRIELMKRSSDLTVSTLDMVYLPIQKRIPPPPPTAKVPF